MYAKVSAAIDWIKEITNYQDPGILESRVDTTTPSARDVIIQNLSYPDSLFDIIEQGKYLVESKECSFVPDTFAANQSSLFSHNYQQLAGNEIPEICAVDGARE